MSRIATFTTLACLLSQATASVKKRITISAGNDVTINSGNNGNSCPNGWENYQSNSQSKCCPGAIYNEDDNSNNDDSAYCCVGATYSVARPSFSSCFPFCTSSGGGDGVSVIQTSKQPCSATVFLTDADYSSKVSSASASISGGGAMTTDGLETTDSSGGAQETGSSSTSSGGASIITSGPLAGAMMVAGGLLFI